MVHVVNELKRKSAEIATEVDDLRSRITRLEQQRAAFDVVIQTYDPDHSSIASVVGVRHRRRGDNDISDLFKGFDRRSSTLRTLRHAGRPITTAECASAFALEIGLDQRDPRIGKIGNRFSQVLDQLAKSSRVRRAGMADGHRHLWDGCGVITSAVQSGHLRTWSKLPASLLLPFASAWYIGNFDGEGI